ncbi:hypothetical protein B0H16DRAFT_1501271 [Mycena metata]|uniref:Secreted protein n=1 Tax=Mycena metata TaxID=1033252 RepID=A0AAD7NWU5_9AGAR|nr:hypothetical protein B0H16DRAFT_1501271 [Mycena metata]
MHRCGTFSSFLSSLLNLNFFLSSHTSTSSVATIDRCVHMSPSSSFPSFSSSTHSPHALLRAVEGPIISVYICRLSCYLRGIQLRFCTSNLSL